MNEGRMEEVREVLQKIMKEQRRAKEEIREWKEEWRSWKKGMKQEIGEISELMQKKLRYGGSRWIRKRMV